MAFGVNVTIVTNSVGEAFYPRGYALPSGTYAVTATYNGVTATAAVTVVSGEVNEVTISLT